MHYARITCNHLSSTTVGRFTPCYFGVCTSCLVWALTLVAMTTKWQKSTKWRAQVTEKCKKCNFVVIGVIAWFLQRKVCSHALAWKDTQQRWRASRLTYADWVPPQAEWLSTWQWNAMWVMTCREWLQWYANFQISSSWISLIASHPRFLKQRTTLDLASLCLSEHRKLSHDEWWQA